MIMKHDFLMLVGTALALLLASCHAYVDDTEKVPKGGSSAGVGKSGKDSSDHKPLGRPLVWRWSNEKANLDWCIEKHLSDFDAEVMRSQEDGLLVNIRKKKDSKILYVIKEAHENTVFARWKDVLYIAEYSPIGPGCSVVAVDLTSGKELWRSYLEGNSPKINLEYRNLVNIETDGELIIVFGNETHGRYIEYLDLRSGKTLANKKLEPID